MVFVHVFSLGHEIAYRVSEGEAIGSTPKELNGAERSFGGTSHSTEATATRTRATKESDQVQPSLVEAALGHQVRKSRLDLLCKKTCSRSLHDLTMSLQIDVRSC